MKSVIRIAVLVAFVAAAAPVAKGSSDLWLHVRVSESGSRPTTVKINVPFALVERAAPLIEDAEIDDGDVEWNGDQMEIAELREVWRSLRSGTGRITRDETTWELVREGGAEMLVVREERPARDGAVVRVPAPLVDALLADERELDLSGAVSAIARIGAGELVAVDEDGTRVRIWLDRVPEGE